MESKEKLSVEDYQDFFLDNTNPIAAKIAHQLASLVDTENQEANDALDLLINWDGNHKHEAKAPILYEKLLYHTIYLAMQHKIDSSQFQEFFNTHLVKSSLDKLIHNDKSVWWDDLTTDKKESRKDIVNQAFNKSITELKEQLGPIKNWKWGNVHTLEHPHPLGQVALLKPFFNVGTFKMDAADAVLNKLAYVRDGSGVYNIKTGPSTRRLVNFADVENSYSILPTGQSGNPLSDHYNDQAEMYAAGKWRKMLMNKEEIVQQSLNSTLVLKK